MIKVGAGDNVIIGGLGADQITMGDGNNVVLGDSGYATFDATSGKHLVVATLVGGAAVGGSRDTGTSSDDTINLGKGSNVVIGGAGADSILFGSTGSDVVIGDDGEADFDPSGKLTDAKSIDATYGGLDTIAGARDAQGKLTDGGSGGSTVIGGLYGDTIQLGGAGNTIIGDNGEADFAAGVFKTTDGATGGDDTITVSGGSNTILGGWGADQITTTGTGGNVILGDNGQATFTSGVLTRIETTDATLGGDDVIKVGAGDNVIIGGLGADQITMGDGNNVVLGDSGYATFDATSGKHLVVATLVGGAAVGGSRDTGTSSDDTITLGVGNNVVIGGAGSDRIIFGAGSDVILGDDGEADFTDCVLRTIMTSDNSWGGDDTIGGATKCGMISAGGSGSSVAIGGLGNDTILLGGASNVVIGDNGKADFDAASLAQRITSLDAGFGGNDWIWIGGGNNIVFGGTGDDTIKVGDGVNVIAGDDGLATFDIVGNNSVLNHIETLWADDGGADDITAGNGANVIFGGSGSDRIKVGSGNNILLGDNGQADFTAGVLTMIEATDGAYGGDDTIGGGDGNSVVIGGFGADTIALGDGSDIILGDSGHADFTKTGILKTIYSTLGKEQVAVSGASSNDTIILGDGNNVVIGGAGAESIILGSGFDVVIGDDGEADYTNGVLTTFWSTDALYGGDDTISGPFVGDEPGYGGSGHSAVIGGIGADKIYLGGDANLVFGDNGRLTFNDAGLILTAQILDPYAGGDDVIKVSGGANLIFGGAGSDDISVNVIAGGSAGSGNVILGDDGDAHFTLGMLDRVETNTPDVGGADTITGGDGDNVVLGGSGSDRISLGAGRNLIIGDNGYVTYSTVGVVEVLATTDPDSGGDDTIVGGGGDNVVLGGFGADHITLIDGENIVIGDNGEADFTVGVLTRAVTASAAYGGNDAILVGAGDNIVLGGSGSDTINAGRGRNVIAGDNGEVDLVAGVLALVVTSDTSIGGDDTITGGLGDDTVLGGFGADHITLTEGNDLVIGDNGEVDFINGVIVKAMTSSPAAGGGDTISLGGGNDIVFGGAGSDWIKAGDGHNVIIGDNGEADFLGGVIALAFTTDPLVGGNDTIFGGDGGNVVIGGFGDDSITTGRNVDRVLGDNGLAQFTLTSGVLAPLSLQTTDTKIGGNDTINVGDGGNIVYGGAGDDSITAGNGDNDIIGDNNMPDGAVGNDTIHVGNGNNVILGDNGQIYRQVIQYNWGAMQWACDPAPFNDLIRQVTTYGLLGGDDHIFAGDGMNRIFGQGGADDIHAGNGSNEIIGGLGWNAIYVGSGNNTIIEGEGRIARTLDANGAPVLNSDGVTWHRDVVLMQVGSITGAVALDSSLQSDSAASLLNADAILLGGSYNADGSKRINQADQSWRTQALLVTLEPVSGGSVNAGDGANVIFGTTGDNTIQVGNGANVIFGDRAVNVSAQATDIPHILNGYLIVAVDPSTGIKLPFNGQLVTPAINLLPSLLTPTMPQLELGPGDLPGSISGLSQAGDLTNSDGSHVAVLASVIPQLLRPGAALSGNDTITAGNGDNLIFGDYGIIGAVPTTGIAVIDAQLQGLSVTAMGLLTQLSALATAQDALDAVSGHAAPYAVSIGNDHITVGTGSNSIFGDVGQYVIPGVGVARGGGTLVNDALAFDARLLDLQEILGEASFVANEAGRQVIAKFASATHFQGYYDASAQLRPATHVLNIGDDVISINGGYGSNLVIGDNGVVLMPGVGTATANWANGASAAELADVDWRLRAFEASRGAAMSAQFAANHPFAPENDAAAQSLFNGGRGFQLNVGDDTIYGGGGSSIIIGDTGLVLDPVIAPGSNAADAANDVEATMVATIDRLFLGAYAAALAIADSRGVAAALAQTGAVDWSSAGGLVFNESSSDIRVNNDMIYAGDGASLIFGDNGVVLPQMGSANGLITAFRAFPSGETGGTAMADYNYIYGFGPLGALHAWRSPSGAPSYFGVDADTITGGAGASVMFGELGDDVIAGGSGNEQISGGWGFNTLSGGGGTNYIVYNRAHDSYRSSGGHDIARSALAVSAGSTILQTNLSSPMGQNLASRMMSDPPTSRSWSGQPYPEPLDYVTVTPATVQAGSYSGFGVPGTGAGIGGFFSAASIPPVQMPVESFVQTVIWLAPVLPPMASTGSGPLVAVDSGGLVPDGVKPPSLQMTVLAGDGAPPPSSDPVTPVADPVGSDPIAQVAGDPEAADTPPVVPVVPLLGLSEPIDPASVTVDVSAPALDSARSVVLLSAPVPPDLAPEPVTEVTGDSSPTLESVSGDQASVNGGTVVVSAPPLGSVPSVVPLSAPVPSDPAPVTLVTGGASPTIEPVSGDQTPVNGGTVDVSAPALDSAPSVVLLSAPAPSDPASAPLMTGGASPSIETVSGDQASVNSGTVVVSAPAVDSAPSPVQQGVSLPPPAVNGPAQAAPAPIIASGLVLGKAAPSQPSPAGSLSGSAPANPQSQHSVPSSVSDLAAWSLLDLAVATPPVTDPVPPLLKIDAGIAVEPTVPALYAMDPYLPANTLGGGRILSTPFLKPDSTEQDSSTLLISSPVMRSEPFGIAPISRGAGVAREVIPLDGLIKAIRESEITVRMVGPDTPDDSDDLRLFDEALGEFVSRSGDLGSFFIDLSPDVGASGLAGADPRDQHPMIHQEAAMVAQGPSWLSFLKKFGRGEGRPWFGA